MNEVGYLYLLKILPKIIKLVCISLKACNIVNSFKQLFLFSLGKTGHLPMQCMEKYYNINTFVLAC